MFLRFKVVFQRLFYDVFKRFNLGIIGLQRTLKLHRQHYSFAIVKSGVILMSLPRCLPKK